jgi:hypothetical protein
MLKIFGIMSKAYPVDYKDRIRPPNPFFVKCVLVEKAFYCHKCKRHQMVRKLPKLVYWLQTFPHGHHHRDSYDGPEYKNHKELYSLYGKIYLPRHMTV